MSYFVWSAVTEAKHKWNKISNPPSLCGICNILQNWVIHRPFTLISCFGVLSLDNEPVCSKSNYPFYFLTLSDVREYIHYPLPQTTPNTTRHIKGTLWKRRDSKWGEGRTCFHQLKRNWARSKYLPMKWPWGTHSVPNQLYLYSCQLGICSLIKAMWHLRHRVKQMAVFCWTGL